MIQPAKRMQHFSTSIHTDFSIEKQRYQDRTSKEILDFSLGSPDIAPDPSIVKTMQEAVKDVKNYRYAVRELEALLQEIQTWYQKRYQVHLGHDQMICLQGSQEALVNLPLAFCDPGDIVLVPDPYYPIFAQAPALAQAEVQFMPMKKENQYLIDLDEIDPEVAKKTKMMIVSYPNNPTGATAPDWFYKRLIEFAKQYDILVVHDNAYSELVFDEKEGKSFLSFPGAMEVGIELNSFSKTYGMAGCRLGVLVGNEQALKVYRQLKANLDYGIFLPVQYAGIQALSAGGKTIESTRHQYQTRRDVLVQGFQEAGWQIEKNAATMFLWAQIPDAYQDANDFAKKLVLETGILVTPGTVFGTQGQRFVRIALVQSESVIDEAIERLKQCDLF